MAKHFFCKSCFIISIFYHMVPTDHDIPFFKDFLRTFEVQFQGVFKDFFFLCSLFSQTSIREKNDQQWTFQIRHTETIWFSKVQNTQNKKSRIQGRSPNFKDFSRTNSFSITFQGKPKIQGLFKDCGNPVSYWYNRICKFISICEFFREWYFPKSLSNCHL